PVRGCHSAIYGSVLSSTSGQSSLARRLADWPWEPPGCMPEPGALLFHSSVQAVFRRRRHQPRRPPHAKIRPGRPAPTIGPGTATDVLSVANPFATNARGSLTQLVSARLSPPPLFLP